MRILAASQRDRMNQQRPHRIQALTNALRTPRQIHNQTSPTQTSHAPRKPRPRLMLAARDPHLLRDARHRPLDHHPRRLRSDIPRSTARPASRNHKINPRSPLQQSRSNRPRLIRNHRRPHNLKSKRDRPLPRGRPRFVLINARINPVAHRNHSSAKWRITQAPPPLRFAAGLREEVSLRVVASLRK